MQHLLFSKAHRAAPGEEGKAWTQRAGQPPRNWPPAAACPPTGKGTPGGMLDGRNGLQPITPPRRGCVMAATQEPIDAVFFFSPHPFTAAPPKAPAHAGPRAFALFVCLVCHRPRVVSTWDSHSWGLLPARCVKSRLIIALASSSRVIGKPPAPPPALRRPGARGGAGPRCTGREPAGWRRCRRRVRKAPPAGGGEEQERRGKAKSL